MKLIPISAGSFHCDGGALFGVIPKMLWSKVYKADENNFTRLALRCLLVDSDDQKILIETGIGNHYSEKHLSNNGYVPGNYLVDSLAANGYTTNDITDVLLTHLHWDHSTGGVVNGNNDRLRLLFPGARYWCSKIQMEHAFVSNPREQAAYHTGILNFLKESGRLNLVEEEGELFRGVEIHFVHGHTPGQMIPVISYKGTRIVYTSDLIPTAAHIPLLWIAAYDLDPVQVMKEKEKLLQLVAAGKYYLFFEHDYTTECASVVETEKGFSAGEVLSLSRIGLQQY